MSETQKLIDEIEKLSNSVVAKLEILRVTQNDEETIKKELETIKQKLDNGDISKFSYATMLEINKKRVAANTNAKKEAWDDIAETVNNISDNLAKLKDEYNKVAEVEGEEEIKIEQ